MHEIHAPALGGTGRYRGRATMQRDMLPAPYPHTQLQSVETIEPANPFAIHPPSFPTQEHPDPEIPKSWTALSDVPNPQA